MWLIYQTLRLLSWPFSVLSMACASGFAVILGMPAKRLWLLPLTLLLLPVALGLAVLAVAFYVPAMLFILPAALGLATRAVPEENGVRLTLGRHRVLRVLSWHEIKEFRRVFTPPFHAYLAVLDSGESVRIDLVEMDALAAALEQRGIPFVGRDGSQGG